MNKTSKFEELVEKYRMWIGGILILAIVAGSAVLIWRENYAKPKLEDQIAKLEDKLDGLEEDLTKKQDASNNNQTNSTNPAVAGQNSNTQNEGGSVAGASNQPSDGILKQVQDDSKIAGKINLNTATLAQLDSLTGIGPVYAQRIIDYRNSHGGFKSIDEVKNVKGIGEKTFEKFKDKIGI